MLAITLEYKCENLSEIDVSSAFFIFSNWLHANMWKDKFVY